MEASTSVDMTAQDLLARRERAAIAIRRLQPMSVWTQLGILLFSSAMTLLVASVSYFVHGPNPLFALSILMLSPIFLVAGNAMHTQRRLSALVDLVLQTLEEK